MSFLHGSVLFLSVLMWSPALSVSVSVLLLVPADSESGEKRIYPVYLL